MKKLIYILFISVVMFSLAALTAGCTEKLDESEAYGLIREAIVKSEAAPFYYYKETVLSGGQAQTKRVNLLGDIDSDYNPVFNENGSIRNYKLNITRLQGEKEISSVYCGKPAGKEDEYLILINGSEKTAIKKPLAEYLNSDEFKPHSLAEMLKSISALGKEDIAITSAAKKDKVVLIRFTVSESFLERFQAENGVKSVFDGIKYAEIEVSYGRISAITAYADSIDERSKVKIEVEPHRIQITYYGPNFTLPGVDG